MFKKIKSKIGTIWNSRYGKPKEVKKYLAYYMEAKQTIRSYPKLISNFLEMRKKVLNVEKEINQNLVLENIAGEVTGSTATRFYRLLIQGKPYFVKEIQK